MTPIPKKDVAAAIAAKTGLDETSVKNVLNALSDVASANAHLGVLIFGLGEIRAQRGTPQAFRHPMSGEEIQIPGPIEICFTPDTDCQEKFSNSLATAEIGDRMPQMAEPPPPLPEVRLYLDDRDRDSAGILSELADESKMKIGGSPDWIQYPDVPMCCKHEMTFYGQLDSRIGGRYNLWDCGIVYVFVCTNCGGHTSKLQSY